MRVEDDADVEVFVEGGLDADFDVVEVDEDRDVETFLMRQNCVPCRQAEARDATLDQSSDSGWLSCSSRRRFAVARVEHASGARVAPIRTLTRAGAPGASGVGQRTRVNWPRWSSSRPLPPRPVTSYLAVLMVCSAPRLVSTVSRSRSPGRGDEAEHAVVVAQLDEDDALARAGQVVHLVGPAEQAARLGGGGDQRLAAGEPRDADDLGALGRPGEPAAGARARLDEGLEAEAEAVAVARHGDAVHRRRVVGPLG